MVIEIYIDTEELTNNQSLAILDDQAKRWDVEEVLASLPGASGASKRGPSKPEMVLERWQIQLGEPSKELSKDLPVILPRVYKNSIVLFRSLLAFAKLLPAWSLAKRTPKSRSTSQTPKLKYRIVEGSQFNRSPRNDTLTIRLFDTSSAEGKRIDEVVEHYPFEPIHSPAGPFSIQVSYRLQCDFRIDDSEALLSSHFMGLDEQFEPSLGREREFRDAGKQQLTQGPETGSLPQGRQGHIEQADQSQAYGSMSTFHQPGPPTASSPMSALRAARDRASESPTEQPQPKAPPGPRLAQAPSKSSLRSSDGTAPVGRRASVTFKPFKTETLSASPSHGESRGISSPHGSLGRTSALSSLAEARKSSTLGPQGIIPSRGSPSTSEQVPPSSVSNSPKPSISRYSSSFGHRRAKLSVGGSSKAEEDNNSSGRGSGTSSKPGSGILAEGGGASSGSIQTDDDNISDFLKLLDQKKELKSFRRPSDQSAVEASTRRTNAALGRFQRMRDSNAALSESMSSSLMMHRSSSSSSRQLSSVPPMVAGTSISTSTSPGKPISPHTPHTPAIPSRLSAHSVAEYSHLGTDSGERPEEDPDTGQTSREHAYWEASPGAIDIPASPRPFRSSYRRSISASRQQRTVPIEDEFPFGLRSASLGGADDRPHPSLSALLRLQEDRLREETAIAHPSVEQEERPFGSVPAAVDGGSSVSMTRQPSAEENASSQPSHRPSFYRPWIGHRAGGGRGHTPPHGSISSLDRASAGSGSSDQPGGARGGGRYSFTRPASTFEEDELPFAMSDVGTGQQPGGRKSQEGGGDSGQSSRRGSRWSRGPG